MTTFAYELHCLADQISDLEVENRELKHRIFLMENERNKLPRSDDRGTRPVPDVTVERGTNDPARGVTFSAVSSRPPPPHRPHSIRKPTLPDPFIQPTPPP